MPTLPDPIADPAPSVDAALAMPAETPVPTAAAAGTPLAFAAMLLGNAILAFGPWSVRLADVGPVASGFWRLTLAMPVLLAIAWRSGRGTVRLSRPVLGLIAIGGVCFALDLASWHAGIVRTRLANATLFGNVTSFFFVAYGFLVARTWPSRVQTVALLLALAGVGLLMGRSYEVSRVHLGGDLLCLAAGVAYVGYMIVVDRVRGRLGTWPTLAGVTVAGAAMLLPLALLAGDTLWPHRWVPLIALAFGSQLIGQGLIVYVIGALPQTVVGLGLLTQPVVAATIGWIAYGERLTLPDFIGAGAIAVALVLIRRR